MGAIHYSDPLPENNGSETRFLATVVLVDMHKSYVVPVELPGTVEASTVGNL
jgi:hypothetical protein